MESLVLRVALKGITQMSPCIFHAVGAFVICYITKFKELSLQSSHRRGADVGMFAKSKNWQNNPQQSKLIHFNEQPGVMA